MMSKRLVDLFGAAVLGGLGLLAGSWARADEISAVLNQDQANRLSIFHDHSISAVGTTGGEIPGTPGEGIANGFLGRWAADQPGASSRLWSLSATPLVGYDSNPEARKDARSSVFAGANLDASIGFQLDPDDPQNPVGSTRFLFSYDLDGGLYKGDVKQADVIQQTGSAFIRQGLIGDTIVLAARASDQFTLEHSTAFLNNYDVVPSAEIFWMPQLSTEISYDYADFSYYFRLDTRAHDPNAVRHTVMGYLHLYTLPQPGNGSIPEGPDRFTEIIRNLLSRATLGFGHVWNVAKGTDYTAEANRLVLGFDNVRPFKTRQVSFDIEYAHDWEKYLSPSSFTAVVLSKTPAIRRRDHMDVLTVRGNARLADLARDRGTLGGFLQWDLISDRSNVPVRDFNEFMISAGITYRY